MTNTPSSTDESDTEIVPDEEATPAPAVTADPRVATPTPPEYEVGAAKQDPATFAVAVRTNILDPENRKDWGVMSIDRGGMYATWDQVAAWTDMQPVTTP